MCQSFAVDCWVDLVHVYGNSLVVVVVLTLDQIPIPALPTLLLSVRDFAPLRLRQMPPAVYIQPEAMAASLAVSTRLETLRISFHPSTPPPEQRRSRPDSPMRAILPALVEFEFIGHGECVSTHRF